jgi:tRNA threonylcarbamoyladenosine biosynthesis protein TsaE
MATIRPATAARARPGSGATVASHSPEETLALGAALAAVSEAGDLVCLWGDLGAGKTVLAKGFGAGLGVAATISSPTFVLMGEYQGRLPLFHLDLYRLADAADALAGGLIDERQAAGVTVVEWPDRLGPTLPAERLDIEIEGATEQDRLITVSAGGESLERYVRAARAFTAGP